MRYPVFKVVGVIDAETFPEIDDHPMAVAPAEDVGAFARTVADAGRFATIGPGDEVGAVGVVDGFAIPLVVIPQAPAAGGERENAGVDYAIGGEGKRAGVFPGAEVGAGEMNDGAGVSPVFEYAGHDGEEHVVRAVGRGDHVGCPKRRFGGGELDGKIDVGGAKVGPRGAAV